MGLAPGLIDEFDMGEMLCLIAPRHCLAINSKEDQRCPLGGVGACVQYAKDNLKSLGWDLNCIELKVVSTAVKALPMGHGLIPSMYATGLAFIEKHLFEKP